VPAGSARRSESGRLRYHRRHGAPESRRMCVFHAMVRAWWFWERPGRLAKGRYEVRSQRQHTGAEGTEEVFVAEIKNDVLVTTVRFAASAQCRRTSTLSNPQSFQHSHYPHRPVGIEHKSLRKNRTGIAMPASTSCTHCLQQ
jgi:hypothetical protein